MPPSCRPECVTSSECPQDKACVREKCIDPCPGTCGSNARCQVRNHNPICSCAPGYTGDPFVQCQIERSERLTFLLSLMFKTSHSEILEVITDVPAENPCVPSPCGPYSACQIVGNLPACSCLPNYIGRSPNCRPECTINAECSSNLACINERCADPCIGSCGVNSLCTVVKHNPVCQCKTGYSGDPFSVCSEIQYCKAFIFFYLLSRI
jgi:hypothetical protein